MQRAENSSPAKKKLYYCRSMTLKPDKKQKAALVHKKGYSYRQKDHQKFSKKQKQLPSLENAIFIENKAKFIQINPVRTGLYESV